MSSVNREEADGRTQDGREALLDGMALEAVGSAGGWVASGAGSLSHRSGDRLRVALVVPPYFDVPPAAYGGVEAVVADLADALVERGHAVTLFGAGRPGTRAAFVPVWDCPMPERLGEPFPEVVHAVVTRRAVEWLAAEESLDVVHYHTLAGPLNAPPMRR